MIKKLLKSLREYKTPSLLSILFIVLEVACDIALPFVIQYLIDNLTTGDYVKLYLYGGLLVGISLISLLFGFYAAKFASKASTGFAKNLRKDLFYKVQDFSFSNIDKFSSSSLVTRMTTDVQWVQMAYGMIIRGAFRAPLMFVFSIVAAFFINAQLAWIFVIMTPIIGGVLVLLARFAHPIFDKVFTRYDALNASVEENVRGIRTVKTYVREDYEKKKFGNASDDITKNFIKANKILAWQNPTMNVAMHVSITLISILGAYIVTSTYKSYNPQTGVIIYGALSTGQISSLITYGVQSFVSLMFLTMIGVMVVISITSMRRIVEVLDEVPDIKDKEKALTTIKDGSVEFKDVNFKYKKDAEKYALKGINLNINSGEFIGILGATGSSKTTLISLISRLYDTTTGEVKVGGVNVKDYNLKTLRDNVSVVLQKNVLFSGTIKENLRWGNPNATDDEIVHACKLAQADEFIRSFPEGYDTHIEQNGNNVSGGQKQRLCIARALLKNPKILILDDSTSAVDTKTDALIRKAFKEEIPHCTRIVIAQRVASLQEADQIFIMDNGTIVAHGKHDELLKTSDIYRETYEMQNRD
jgi:ABC-type multidrug transport system, ATPase and permease components